MARPQLLWLFLLGGCSAIVDDSTQQCKEAADCAPLGAGLMCNAGFCESATGAQAECQTTDDCVMKRGAGYSCSTTKACELGCTKHSECTAKLGMAAICRVDGQCAALMSPLCDEVIPAGAEKSDDMFLVGFIGLVKGPDSSYGLAQKEGEKIALNELQNQASRLPGATGNDSRRNLAMLVCDHGTDGTEAANHLVNNLKVPAVLGASYSGITINAFNITQPRDVLLFSPAATSPVITDTADPKDLLWRTVPSDKLQSEAIKQLVPLVTQALYANGSLPAGTRPKLAIPYKDDAAGGGLKNGVQNPPNEILDAAFLTHNVGMLESDMNYRIARAKEIIDAQPNIIIHLGTGEFIQWVLPLVEMGWTGKTRPWWIVPEGDLEKFKEMTSESTITAYDLASRLVGTAPGGRRSPEWRRFQANFQGGQPGNLAEFAYDAVYLLAYAISASGKQYPSGLDLAAGLRKTSCKTGPKIAGGVSDFGTGWTAARNGCLDYFGPSGDLDFGPAGEADTDIAVGCLQKTVGKYDFIRVDTYYPIPQRTLTAYKGTLLDLTKPGWCTPVVP